MLEKKKNKENKKLIPLRRFSETGPYSAAYLSNLVQRKKLKAKKVGRNFFTTQEWFNEYLEIHAQYGKRQEIEKREEISSESKVENPINLPAGKATAKATATSGQAGQAGKESTKTLKISSIDSVKEPVDIDTLITTITNVISNPEYSG